MSNATAVELSVSRADPTAAMESRSATRRGPGQARRRGRQGVLSQSAQRPAARPADNRAGRLRCISPCGARAESRWLAVRGHEAALVEVPERPDRAGPSEREAAHRWAVKAELRLQSGTRCLRLDVCTA